MIKSDQLSSLLHALEFAAHKHQGQKRKGADGIPYINHPIEVAKMIADEIGDASPELLMAALLHDTLEDTETTAEELERQFDTQISDIVKEVSDDMKMSSNRRKSLQVEHAAKLSYHARCIRIADKACNIRDLLHTRIYWLRKRKIDYVIWAMQVVNEIRDTNENIVTAFDSIVAEASVELKYEF